MKPKLLDKQFLNDVSIALLLFSGGAGLVIATSDDIGITYDELPYSSRAFLYLEWLRLLWDRFKAGDFLAPFSQPIVDAYWHAKDMQPPFPKMVGGLSFAIVRNLTGDSLAAMRSGTALLFGVLLTALYLACRTPLGRGGALFAVLSLLFMPRFFGHAHLLTIDVPMAATAFIATTALATTVASGKMDGNGREAVPYILWLLGSAVAFGLALATKANALLIPVAVALWITLEAFLCSSQYPVASPQSAVPKSSLPTAYCLLPTAYFRLLICCLGGLLVFFALWCWLWFDPWHRLMQYLAFHLKHYPIGVFYFGRTTEHAPWHYPLVMTAITVPTLTLLLAVAGMVLTVRRWREAPTIIRLALVSFWVQVFPFMLPSTPKYNGERLFLSAFPFLAVLSGYAFVRLCEAAQRKLNELPSFRASRLPTAYCLLATVLLAPAVRSTAAVHPFELSYYNALVGGTKGAVERGFEGTYWGETLMHLLPDLNRLPDGAKVFIIPSSLQAYMRFYQDAGMLKRTLRFTGDERRLDEAVCVLFQCRQSEFTPLAWRLWEKEKPIFAVSYDGVHLAMVYALKRDTRYQIPD